MKSTNKKIKNFFVIGAVIISLLLISSVIVVPQVNSQTIMSSISQKEKLKDELNSVISIAGTQSTFNPDKTKVLKLTDTINKFLDENNLKITQTSTTTWSCNFQETIYYNDPVFQNFIKKYIVNEDTNKIQELLNTVESKWQQYVKPDSTEKEIRDAEKIITTEFVVPFFRNLFNVNNEEYTAVLNSESFTTCSRSLADSLKNVYKSKSKDIKNLGSTDNDNFKNKLSTSNTQPIYLENILVTLCTLVFLANWMACGNFLGAFTQVIVGFILALLLVVPCIFILLSEIAFDAVGAFWDALLSTAVIFIGFFGQTLFSAVYAAGALGLAVWVIGFLFNLSLLPYELLVILVIQYFMYANKDPGYIIIYLGPLIGEIINQAAENAYDIWTSIWGSPNSEIHTFKIQLTYLFRKFLERYRFLQKFLFAKSLAI